MKTARKIISMLTATLMLAALLPATLVSAAAPKVVIDQQFTMPYPYSNVINLVSTNDSTVNNDEYPGASAQVGKWYTNDTTVRSTTSTLQPMRASQAPTGAAGSNVLKAIPGAPTTGTWGFANMAYVFPTITGGDVTIETRILRAGYGSTSPTAATVNLNGIGIQLHSTGYVRILGEGTTNRGTWTAGQWHDVKIVLKWNSQTNQYDKAQYWVSGSGNVPQGVELSIATPITSTKFVNFGVPRNVTSADAYLYIDYFTISVDGDYYLPTKTLSAPTGVSWTGNLLNWEDLQTDVASYEVALYKNGAKTETYGVGTSVKSFDFTNDINDIASVWTATVKAKGIKQSMASLVEDSVETAPVQWTSEAPPAVPTNVVWDETDDTVLKWDYDAEATSYDVFLYKLPDETTPVAEVTGITGTECDLINDMAVNVFTHSAQGYGTAQYKAAVKSYKNTLSGDASALSDAMTFNLEDYRRTVATVDFEQDSGYSAGALPSSGKVTYTNAPTVAVMEEGSQPMGQYLSYANDQINDFFNISAAELSNDDVVSVKFKFYKTSDVTIDLYFTGIHSRFVGNGTGTYTKIPSGGNGAAQFSNNFTAVNGEWNTAEIRFFKDTAGVGNYMQAEYYINGVKGETDNTAPTMRSTSGSPLAGSVQIRTPDVKGTVLLDEIYVDIFTKDKLPALPALDDAPKMDAAGKVSFNAAANTNYTVKLYKDSGLVSTQTVVAGEAGTKTIDFSAKNKITIPAGGYTATVEAKGNNTVTKNSATKNTDITYGTYTLTSPVTAITGDNFRSMSKASKGTGDDKPFALILAVYDLDGTLIGVDAVDTNALTDGQLLVPEVTISDDVVASYFKVFGWMGINTMTPVSGFSADKMYLN